MCLKTKWRHISVSKMKPPYEISYSNKEMKKSIHIHSMHASSNWSLHVAPWKIDDYGDCLQWTIELKVKKEFTYRDFALSLIVQLYLSRKIIVFYFGFDYFSNLILCWGFNSLFLFEIIPVASTEDSPIANKLKRIWFKTPIGEEQATQAVLDPVVGM